MEEPLVVVLTDWPSKPGSLPNFRAGGDLTVLCYGESVEFRFTGAYKKRILDEADYYDLGPEEVVVQFLRLAVSKLGARRSE